MHRWADHASASPGLGEGNRVCAARAIIHLSEDRSVPGMGIERGLYFASTVPGDTSRSGQHVLCYRGTPVFDTIDFRQGA